MNHLRLHDCPLCIDGHAPGNVLPILGPVYYRCPNLDLCPGCDSDSVFPANFTYFSEFADFLTRHNLNADLCDLCYGVTDVYRPEVTT